MLSKSYYELWTSLYSVPKVLEGYSDANRLSDVDEIKGTSGYVFTFGGDAIS